ncbi:MAG TPA: hypothetical protein PKM25_02225 [Candidatus Ozemobacteraceae bacterium]|nr:hypothetical protein [Candidatus Ozemobacteraceae bacterium]
MRVNVKLSSVPLKALAALILMGLCLLAGTAGCGSPSRPVAGAVRNGAVKPEPQAPGISERQEQVSRTSGHPAPEPENAAAAAARQREEKINTELERVSAMLKGSNYEGALREADRLQADNARDPNVTMRTSYLKAMIFHRMNDGARRKEAMNQMLKSMEALQKDPRFRAAYEDGKAGSELIKLSVEKSGKKYGSN